MGAPVSLAGVTQAFSGREGSRLALGGVDLDLAPGELVCVVGPSGCGKSTLLDLVAGHTRPARGTVTVAGRAVAGPGPDRVITTKLV